MLEFKKLGNDVLKLKDYFEKSNVNFCDYSVGVKFMWKKSFVCEYAIFNDTLILKESCSFYENAFYYPMGKDVSGALNEIENYCKKTGAPLTFCCIDNSHVAYLSARYPFLEVTNNRDNSDYIYDAEAFKAFSGKKYSGQRNHINKFKKTYKNFEFKKISEKDIPRIKVFLSEYERENDFSSGSAKEEERYTLDFIESACYLRQNGGYIEVDGKIIGFSFGEKVGNTLIVHIEKALKSYEGVYPTLANEFAKAFATEGVKYINREDDSGDDGLRISKLQYHPIEVKEKNIVKVFNAFTKMVFPVELKTERLCISEIKESDKAEYFRLYTDEKLNEYYGYDYKTDCKGIPTPEYFFDFQNKLKDTEHEYSFAVRKDGAFIGEVVVYNFGFSGEAEMGFRFLPEYHGFGYAFESVRAIMDYCHALTIKRLVCRAHEKNTDSVKLISKLGFLETKGNDKNFKYFFKDL